MTDKTALYRHFDANGELLYVGISLSAIQRLSQHKTASPWFKEISRVEIEWHPTRKEALAVEKLAIVTENPKHNSVGCLTTIESREERIRAIEAGYRQSQMQNLLRPKDFFEFDELEINLAKNFGEYSHLLEESPSAVYHSIIMFDYNYRYYGGFANLKIIIPAYEGELSDCVCWHNDTSPETMHPVFIYSEETKKVYDSQALFNIVDYEKIAKPMCQEILDLLKSKRERKEIITEYVELYLVSELVELYNSHREQILKDFNL